MKLFVPGRICLFGEHSDWAGGYRRGNPEIEKGYTLICGTDQGIYAQVGPHPSALVLTATTPEGEVCGPYEIPMVPEVLLAEAERGGFWSYVAGTAYQALIHYQVRGLVIHNDRTDLPIQKGLSSSAAICVLTARAFNHVYDLKLTTRGEMELAYQGEITTPSRCGRMDQGCAFGNRPVLMTFDGDRLDTSELQIGRDLHFVIVDLHAQKDTMKILSQLNRCYPCPENEVEAGVHALLGPINRQIVHEAIDAMQVGDAERLGSLMVKAQSYFDRYALPACPDELTAPVLHRVLQYAPLQPHVWGGKGVGSQGDGAAQFVARSQADQQAAADIIKRELGLSCLTLTLRGDGASLRSQPKALDRGVPVTLRDGKRVRKAVIPAAGLGTRLFPATKAIKKEMFPIVDRDGIAKPAILLIVEEALQAGIEEIIIIVQERDLAEFRALFGDQISPEDSGKLPAHLQGYARRLAEIGSHVSFVIQPTQEGFGHAVYLARDAVAGEPFLLMLGDHLYHSRNATSCTRQLLQAYERHGTSVLGLRPTPESEIGRYGTVTGSWIEHSRLLRIAELAEKPSVDYARANLRVDGLPDQEYLTLFGLYITKPQVFDYLEQQITDGVRERQEFQLTTALEQLRAKDGFLGLVIDGLAYDIGLPEAYAETVHRFRKA